MSQAEQSPVFMFDNSDPEMQRSYEAARGTFRYFWREVAWERRRIVPALDLACVKAPFSDGRRSSSKNPEVEHMWIGEVDFDGQYVQGELLNNPNWLTSVKAGDAARIPLGEISDWMYAIGGEVYGAYTVNLMRSRMGARELREHDAAWGLDFGNPKQIRLVPPGYFKNSIADSGGVPEEHPMSVNMASSLETRLAESPGMIHETNDQGWTLLHHEALGGNYSTVKVLLEFEADPNAKTRDGKTPLQLARSLGWERVAAILVRAGAK